MDDGRNTWGAAIRLAITWSVLAALTAVVATSVGAPQPVVVLGVIVVGFGLSWARTCHTATQHAARSHRMARVPVHRAHPIG